MGKKEDYLRLCNGETRIATVSTTGTSRKNTRSANDKYLSLCQDAVDFAQHDARFHDGHYDPKTQSCSLREGTAKKDEADKIGASKSVITPEEDEAYMKAVSDGDMDACDKMVRQAAAKAMPNTKVVGEDGFPVAVYHNTDFNFTQFRNNAKPYDIDGFYFYANEPDASYGKNALKVFLDVKNPKVFPDIVHTGDEDYLGKGAERMKSQGHDGVFRYGFEWIALDPSQVKLADPVTYDDAGNVVPLSKRFDKGDDIRGAIGKSVATQDAWVDSGTGNMAWKKGKHSAPKRRPIDRLPKKKVQAIIAENVKLITTIPQYMHPDVANRLTKVLTGRLDAEDFVDWLVDECGVGEGKAYVIAIDQIRKAKERMKVADWKKRGIEYAVWKHRSTVKEPRAYHLTKWDGKSGLRNGRPNGLDGFVFSLDKPPVIDKRTGERGYPSQCIGCRCYMVGIKTQ